MRLRRRPLMIATTFLAALVACVTVAACSSSTGSTATAASSSSRSTGTSSSTAGTRRGGLFSNLDPATLAKVKTCLSAAGLSLPTAGAGGFGGTRRSGAPTGVRPTGARTGPRPSGFPSGAAGGQFQKIEQALTACGITLPSGSFRGPGTRGSGAPGATATPTAAVSG